jgi:membrane protease YdiL (CAAX protease family)
MPGRASNIARAAVPSVAVAVGLYAATSAWAAILLYHAVISVMLTISGWGEPMRLLRSGWRGWGVWLGAVAGVLAGVMIYALWPCIDATPAGLSGAVERYGLHGRSWIVFAIYYSTVHPLLEELFWRGGFMSRSRYPSWRDGAFAAYHVIVVRLFVGPVWVAAIFAVLLVSAWLWRVAVLRFGGLGVPLASHVVADAGIVVAVTLLIQN